MNATMHKHKIRTPDELQAKREAAARRKRDERARKAAVGLTTITLVVPDHAAADFLAMAHTCRTSPEFTPFMVRSQRTGKLAKGV